MSEYKTYVSKNTEVIGPCAPCSFINLVGLTGNKELEAELAELGEMKPFHCGDFTSFLIWAERYKVPLEVFVDSVEIPNGTFEGIFRFEEIPAENREPMKNECISRHSNLVKMYQDSIQLIHKKPIEIVDDLLTQGFSIAYSLAEYFEGEPELSGHVRVCSKRIGDLYIIQDSDRDLNENDFSITKSEFIKNFDQAKQMGLTIFIIAFKRKDH